MFFFFNDNFKKIRQKRGLTQKQMGEKLGMTQQGYASYENGKTQPDINTLIKMAEILKCSVDDLLGDNEKIDTLFDENIAPVREPEKTGKKIKVLGEVPAGVPIEAVEYIIDEIEISDKLVNTGEEYFALLVTGDSMYPEYLDGDIVVVRKQSTADTGQDVIAYVNGYNATLKRLIKSDKGVTLRALNPAYESKFYSNKEIHDLPIQIAGVVVEQRRNR